MCTGEMCHFSVWYVGGRLDPAFISSLLVHNQPHANQQQWASARQYMRQKKSVFGSDRMNAVACVRLRPSPAALKSASC